ncbi:MAG TPA: hypothetical protein P5140_05715 [Methanofastidiosum sp.]|nr:hypothetical protein [Methanofastidiosum sp.]
MKGLFARVLVSCVLTFLFGFPLWFYFLTRVEIPVWMWPVSIYFIWLVFFLFTSQVVYNDDDGKKENKM